MKITRVKPPKYRMGRYRLSEYDLRALMLEVARGEKPSGIVIKDETGCCAHIQEDGSLSACLWGMDIMSIMTLGMIATRRSK